MAHGKGDLYRQLDDPNWVNPFQDPADRIEAARAAVGGLRATHGDRAAAEAAGALSLIIQADHEGNFYIDTNGNIITVDGKTATN